MIMTMPGEATYVGERFLRHCPAPKTCSFETGIKNLMGLGFRVYLGFGENVPGLYGIMRGSWGCSFRVLWDDLIKAQLVCSCLKHKDLSSCNKRRWCFFLCVPLSIQEIAVPADLDPPIQAFCSTRV